MRRRYDTLVWIGNSGLDSFVFRGISAIMVLVGIVFLAEIETGYRYYSNRPSFLNSQVLLALAWYWLEFLCYRWGWLMALTFPIASRFANKSLSGRPVPK
jgi:hypothetical protein